MVFDYKMDFDYEEFLGKMLKEKALINLVDEYRYTNKLWYNIPRIIRGERFRLKKKTTLTFKGMGGKKSIKAEEFYILFLDYGNKYFTEERCVLILDEYEVFDTRIDNIIPGEDGDTQFWLKYDDYLYANFNIKYDFKKDELPKFLFKIKPYLQEGEVSKKYRNISYEQYMKQYSSTIKYINFSAYDTIATAEELMRTIDGYHLCRIDYESEDDE